jgi:hypothetical protein
VLKDAEEMKQSLLAGGMTGPINWYKAANDGVWYEEEKGVSFSSNNFYHNTQRHRRS